MRKDFIYRINTGKKNEVCLLHLFSFQGWFWCPTFYATRQVAICSLIQSSTSSFTNRRTFSIPLSVIGFGNLSFLINLYIVDFEREVSSTTLAMRIKDFVKSITVFLLLFLRQRLNTLSLDIQYQSPSNNFYGLYLYR